MNEQPIKEEIFQILRILSSGGNLTQRDLSSHLGVSLGKTNYLLKSLIEKGLVKIKNFSTRGQKLNKVRYILTHHGFEEKIKLTHAFLERKEREYLQLKKELDEISNNSSVSVKG